MRWLDRLTPNRRQGDRGETAAVKHLSAKGLRILDRNWRYRQWELDIVCRDGDTVVFVEVKTRKADGLGTPGDGLNRKKQQRLVKAASRYLSRHDLWDAPCRFDLVGVTANGSALHVEHTENAFDLTGMEL